MNVKNRTIFTGDNLGIMRGMETESVDMIYLDPPFNSNHDYSAPIGSKAAGAEFKDTWTLSDIDLAWWGEIGEENIGLYEVLKSSGIVGGGGGRKNSSVKSYLIYMAIRLLEMHRILKQTGSLYLHCDPIMSHYLKCVLDSIFSRDNFRNEIIWQRNSGRTKIKHQSGAVRSWGTQHDVILFYTKGVKNLKVLYEEDPQKKFSYKDDNGRKFSLSPAILSSTMGRRPNQEYEYKGYEPKYGWRFVKDTLVDLDKRGYIYWNSKGTPYKKKYEDEHLGKPISNIWTDIGVANITERLGYPTQKPLALLERIIEGSTDIGDIILDPFCGCATACSAAERLDRYWIGIDVSSKAYDLIKSRLKSESGLDKFTRDAGHIIHRTDIPKRKGTRTKDVKHKLYGEQEGYCKGCNHYYHFKDFEVDHIIPKVKGGLNDDFNLQLLCGNCNRVKGGRLTMPELEVELRNRGIIA